MADEIRSALEQEIVQSVIDGNAINFETAGSILSKFGARAALEGTGIVFHIDKHVIRDLCIPVDPLVQLDAAQRGRQV